MGFIKELWSDKIYSLLYEDPDLQMMFNRTLENLARQGGNKIHVPTLGTSGEIEIVQTDNKSVGSGLPLTIKDITKGSGSFEINEYTTKPLVLRNLDIIQASPDLLNEKAAEIAQAFKEHILSTALTHMINNIIAGHKKQWTGGTGGDALKGLDIATLEETLDNAKVLENDRFLAMKSTEQKGIIYSSDLQAWMAQQQSNILRGELPQLHGFGVRKTTQVPLTKADGTISGTPAENVKRNVIGWRKNHMHVVVQTEFEITASERAEYAGTVASFTNRYGVYLERTNGAALSTQQ